MAEQDAPKFDNTVRTEFLRLTIARAITPRARRRVVYLRELERLLVIAEGGYQLGPRGFVLSSIARDYPISARAMALELRGYGPQRLVEVAEQIELKLFVAPRTRKCAQ